MSKGFLVTLFIGLVILAMVPVLMISTIPNSNFTVVTPTPNIEPEASIIVISPKPNDIVKAPIFITGSARVFENIFSNFSLSSISNSLEKRL